MCGQVACPERAFRLTSTKRPVFPPPGRRGRERDEPSDRPTARVGGRGVGVVHAWVGQIVLICDVS